MEFGADMSTDKENINRPPGSKGDNLNKAYNGGQILSTSKNDEQ